MGFIPGSGTSSGGGHGSPLQYSCLENPMGGLQPIGLQRVGHNWRDLTHAYGGRKKKKKQKLTFYVEAKILLTIQWDCT